MVDQRIENPIGVFLLEIGTDETGVETAFSTVSCSVAKIPVDDRLAVFLAEPGPVEVPEKLSLHLFGKSAGKFRVGRKRDFRNVDRKIQLAELIQNLKQMCRVEIASSLHPAASSTPPYKWN